MEGDSDGPGNNDACVPVIPPSEDTPFVPIPIVPIPVVPTPVVPTPVVPTPVVPTPDGAQPTQKPAEKGAKSGKVLAKTGASVLAPIVIGLIMLALGIAILRRRNTE
ncbi:LPXTG cell wall anchor domain-containing protein [Corynebacterium ulcerans]|nr:LPXTG cell wall anchor domain-containing protein [Corynebacterium ulcerans]